MSVVCVFECKHCNKHKELFLGPGRTYYEEWMFGKDVYGKIRLSSYCPQGERAKVTQFIESGKVHLGEICNKALVCKNCQTWNNNLVFDLINEQGGIVYRGNQKCRRCGSQDFVDLGSYGESGPRMKLVCNQCKSSGIIHCELDEISDFLDDRKCQKCGSSDFRFDYPCDTDSYNISCPFCSKDATMTEVGCFD